MSNLLIACLCADWCDTCREYRSAFEALMSEFPQHRFVWVDIEDQADLIGSIEVENFPTLLLAQQAQVLFAGTMLPHIGHLRRLLQTLSEQSEPQLGKLSAAEQSAYQALAAKLDARAT